jgi:toxin ParE1/3/4
VALKLIWQTQAADELAEIYEYIESQDGPELAHKVAQQLYALILSIPEAPMMGRMVPEFDRVDVRERIHGRYRIVYWVGKGAVKILACWHTARPLPSILALLQG